MRLRLVPDAKSDPKKVDSVIFVIVDGIFVKFTIPMTDTFEKAPKLLSNMELDSSVHPAYFGRDRSMDTFTINKPLLIFAPVSVSTTSKLHLYSTRYVRLRMFTTVRSVPETTLFYGDRLRSIDSFTVHIYRHCQMRD